MGCYRSRLLDLCEDIDAWRAVCEEFIHRASEDECEDVLQTLGVEDEEDEEDEDTDTEDDVTHTNPGLTAALNMAIANGFEPDGGE